MQMELDSGDIMSNEENKINQDELQQQDTVQDIEAEVVGSEADIEWNEDRKTLSKIQRLRNLKRLCSLVKLS